MPRKKIITEPADETSEQVTPETEVNTEALPNTQPDSLELPEELPSPVFEEDDNAPPIISADPEPVRTEPEVEYSLPGDTESKPSTQEEISTVETDIPAGEEAPLPGAESVPAYGEDAPTVESLAPVEDAPTPEEPPVSRPKRRATARKSPKRSPEEEERREFYQLDFNELDRKLTPEQQQEWNSIYASYRSRSVISGTVIGVDRHTINVWDRTAQRQLQQEMYCAIVIPFRVRILIPETEMWVNGEERPGFVLRNIVGSKVDMVIIHVDREAEFAIASRRMAMSSRRYYFSSQPTMNRPGSRVKCSVLAVGPRRCLVSCHGYDVDLTQRDMRYTAIPDLRDEYHPGDELDCIIKAYDSEMGKLTVSVKETQPNPFDGAHLRHPVGSKRQSAIAGKYAGGVFCNLPDGAVVMCSYASHYDDAEFAVGDKVIVAIQRYDDDKKQIYGKIVAKW